MTDQTALFGPAWEDHPRTNPDGTIAGYLPTYKCPGCRKGPNGSGCEHVWDENRIYLGTLHRNSCCGYVWAVDAKPSDHYWRNVRSEPATQKFLWFVRACRTCGSPWPEHRCHGD